MLVAPEIVTSELGVDLLLLPSWPPLTLNPKPVVDLVSMAPKLETQFIRACSTGKSEVVRELLQGYISPEMRDTYGLTAFIWAGRKGHVGVAEVLLAGGADLESKDRRGRTALHHAVALKHTDFVAYIAKQGAFLNPVDMHGCTPLDLATMAGDKMVALLEQLGAQRRTSQKPLEKTKGLNRFGSGGAVGGSDLPIEVERLLSCGRWLQFSSLRRWLLGPLYRADEPPGSSEASAQRKLAYGKNRRSSDVVARE